ncbi:MAG: hypothetical protein NTX15_09075 [Candidatus Kapabacteria bacterium]|nr:hypothetical protein [Candidatus Kapabacteria bacterium]
MKLASSWKARLPIVLAVLGIVTATSFAQVDITLTSVKGSYPTEVGWQIVNVATNVTYHCLVPGSSTLPSGVIVNVPAGKYEIRAWDSYGDGWNAASITLVYTVGGGSLVNAATYSLSLKSVNTCPGPTAVTNTAQVIASFIVAPPCFSPSISQQPLAQTICGGGTATFSVTSSMTNGTYEWRRNGTTITTTTTSSYTISCTASKHFGHIVAGT